MFELIEELKKDDEITLGLATHVHAGELWKKLPQKGVSHQLIENGIHWECLDPSVFISYNFPMISSENKLKVKFVEWTEGTDPQLGWGNRMAKIKIKTEEFYVCEFLINNPSLTAIL